VPSARGSEVNVSVLTETEVRPSFSVAGTQLVEAELTEGSGHNLSTTFDVFLSHSFSDSTSPG